VCIHSGEIISHAAESLSNRGSDGVFHAPQNLEKGGHGISPRTMHHLKSFSGWKAFSFAHSFSIVESRINFHVATWKDDKFTR